METIQENAVDFLLYSYFKVTRKADEDDCIKAAIKKAYEDATNQGAFNAIVDNQVERIKEARKNGSDVMYSGMKGLFSATPEEFDRKHQELCHALVEMFCGIKAKDGSEAFTYGNAQKWVNMTLKNLYVMCGIISLFQDKGKGMEELCENFKMQAPCFHVPVDSYILEKVWPQGKGKEDSSWLPGVRLLKSGLCGKYTPEKMTAWSKWGPEDYDSFRKFIKTYVKEQGKTELDWEGPAWIEIAEKRKNKK